MTRGRGNLSLQAKSTITNETNVQRLNAPSVVRVLNIAEELTQSLEQNKTKRGPSVLLEFKIFTAGKLYFEVLRPSVLVTPSLIRHNALLEQIVRNSTYHKYTPATLDAFDYPVFRTPLFYGVHLSLHRQRHRLLLIDNNKRGAQQY